MNKAYSIVWNSSRQAWVVASELARGHGFVLAKNIILPMAIASSIGASWAQEPNTHIGNGKFESNTSVSKSQIVYSGGHTSNVTILQGGTQNVNNSGYTSSTHINNSGTQVVGNLGSSFDTVVSSGGKQTVNSGGTATGTKLSGGTQNVSSGGKAIDAEVYSGGKQTVYSG
ncbi:AIDA repeat-containing protein, partial [Escherichia coli]|nr:AIDA repeat-containing protein [Escherichia coli]